MSKLRKICTDIGWNFLLEAGRWEGNKINKSLCGVLMISYYILVNTHMAKKHLSYGHISHMLE